jgi:hypothetical protein
MIPTGIIVTLLFIALVGFLIYLLVTYIPMPELFKQVIIVVCVILVILWLLELLVGHFPQLR